MRPRPPSGPAALDAGAPYHGLGERLRAQRAVSGISLRELARRIGVSASLISQIETGKVQPSVSTLYALVAELGGSFDRLLFGVPANAGDASDVDTPAGRKHDARPPASGASIQRAGDRKTLQLNQGVRWERLTPESMPGVEFLYVVYQPGAESAPAETYQRHPGREWCYVISGTLHVAVGFDEHVLQPGDSMTYDSSVPHRLTNPGPEPVETVWFLLA